MKVQQLQLLRQQNQSVTLCHRSALERLYLLPFQRVAGKRLGRSGRESRTSDRWLPHLPDRTLRSSRAGSCSGRCVARTAPRSHTRRSGCSLARSGLRCSLTGKKKTVIIIINCNTLLLQSSNHPAAKMYFILIFADSDVTNSTCAILGNQQHVC